MATNLAAGHRNGVNRLAAFSLSAGHLWRPGFCGVRNGWRRRISIGSTSANTISWQPSVMASHPMRRKLWRN